jgi:hypothetical protein
MSAATYTLTAIATIALVACSPSPRYTLHDGTDPQLGGRSTIKLETATGACEILRSCTPSSNTVIHYWKPIHDQKTALLVIQAYQEATNQVTK